MASISDLKRDFERLVKRDRLSHAYLFFGESPAVSASFARSLASYLERGKWYENDRVLTDALFVDSGYSAGINDARDIISFLWKKPVLSPRRTAVVVSADLMTVLAEQAILKAVEEPPEHGLILATVRDPGALIGPLASRFQKIYINETSGAEIISDEGRRYASILLGAPTPRTLSEALKELIAEENDALIRDVVSALIAELHKRPMENWRTMRDLLHRWILINQYNVNKRLQLEAALLEGRGK